MPNHFLEPYKTLGELLKTEQSALNETDIQKLAALAPQIQKACMKISELSQGFSELTSGQIRTAREIIRQLQESVDRSRASWEHYQNQLEEQRKLLQCSKRFLHQARLGQSTRHKRISHSA